MKKLIKLSILISILIILCVPCYAKTRKHSMTDTKLSMAIGDKIQLSISGVDSSEIQWSVKNKKLCKISSKGVLTAKKKGKTKITANYHGAKISLSLSIYPKYGLFNEVIAEDENIIIYLYCIKNGKVYLKFKNKTSHTINVTLMQYEYQGFIYDEFYDWFDLPSYHWKGQSVTFQDDIDWEKEVKYEYAGDKMIGTLMYYLDDNYSDVKSVEFTIKK